MEMSKIREKCHECGKEFIVEVTWAQYNWYWCPARKVTLKELLADKPKLERDMLRLKLCKGCLLSRKVSKI